MRLKVVYCILLLLICPLYTVATAQYFLIGSPRQAVIDVLGKPRAVQPLMNIPNSEVLLFAEGSVELDNNLVVNWQHLNVDRIGITGTLHAFTRGASPADVIAVIGLPTSAKRISPVDNTGKGEKELWSYANASVLFKDGMLIGWTDFSRSLPVLSNYSAGASAPKLGANIAEIDASQGSPSVLIPSQHDRSSLWIYPNNAYFLQGEIICDRATPRLQSYIASHSNTSSALEKVTKWLVQQPYLDYHKPVPSDKELYATFVKQNGAALRAKYPATIPSTASSNGMTSASTARNPLGPRLSAAAQQRAQKNLQQAQKNQAEASYQQALQEAFTKYLSINYIAIPKLSKTTTTAEMKSKLEKLGLTVEVLAQKLASPAGTLYATFPAPGSHVRPKSTVTLYVTQ